MMLNIIGIISSTAFLTIHQCSSSFFVQPPSSSSSPARNIIINNNNNKRRVTYLLSSEKDRVKSAGGGTPIFFPTGDLNVFDPEAEGKLQGSGSLNERIALGPKFDYHSSTLLPPSSSPTTTTAAETNDIMDAQHWLEHLTADSTINFAKPSAPVTATLLGRKRIISQDAPGDIQHIILKLPKNMHYVEGQSLSVIPPGLDPKNKGRPYSPRLYSIASTRYGDLLSGDTVSLCVRRAQYIDPISGVVVPEYNGVCSNYLCDAEPGTSISVAGPVGKTMLLPEHDPKADIIMIATGTGIAPFRGFLHRLFMERTVLGHMFEGKAWLVLGVPVTGGLLYKEEIDAMQQNAKPGQFRVDYAISREMKNPFDGGKMYVQHIIAANADELFHRLDNGAHVYFCGLKGMMPPILETLEQVSKERYGDDVDWSSKLKQFKDNHQWHVEVY